MAERGRIDGAWRDAAGRGDATSGRGGLGAAPTGSRPLGLGGKRDGLIHVPAGYDPGRPAPLVVLLHGAGGNARDTSGLLGRLSDETGFLLLVPESRGRTWDVILDGFGPDVDFLGRALGRVFDGHAVDRSRVALAGFSDGASYALSLGLGNADLFTHLIAFAPGFVVPPVPVGRPRLFVAHGTKDTVLPIDRCSRRIIPQLRRAGYEITYEEFDGPHAVPPAIAIRAVHWFAGPPATAAPAEPPR